MSNDNKILALYRYLNDESLKKTSVFSLFSEKQRCTEELLKLCEKYLAKSDNKNPDESINEDFDKNVEKITNKYKSKTSDKSFQTFINNLNNKIENSTSPETESLTKHQNQKEKSEKDKKAKNSEKTKLLLNEGKAILLALKDNAGNLLKMALGIKAPAIKKIYDIVWPFAQKLLKNTNDIKKEDLSDVKGAINEAIKESNNTTNTSVDISEVINLLITIYKLLSNISKIISGEPFENIPEIEKKWVPQISELDESKEKEKNSILTVLDNNIKKFDKALSTFTSSKVTKSTYKILSSILSSLKKKQLPNDQDEICDLLDKTKILIPKFIASHLVRNKKHSDDQDELTEVSKSLYDGFSGLNNVFFGKKFPDIEDSIDDNLNFESDKDDKTIDSRRLKYYVDLINSDISNLNKSRDFLSSLSNNDETVKNLYDSLNIWKEYALLLPKDDNKIKVKIKAFKKSIENTYNKLGDYFKGIDDNIKSREEAINKDKKAEIQKIKDKATNGKNKINKDDTKDKITKIENKYKVKIQNLSKSVQSDRNKFNDTIIPTITNLANEIFELCEILYHEKQEKVNKAIDQLQKPIKDSEVSKIPTISVDISKEISSFNEKPSDMPTKIDNKLPNNDDAKTLASNVNDQKDNLSKIKLSGSEIKPCNNMCDILETLKTNRKKLVENFKKTQDFDSKAQELINLINEYLKSLTDLLGKESPFYTYYAWSTYKDAPYDIYNSLYTLSNELKSIPENTDPYVLMDILIKYAENLAKCKSNVEKQENAANNYTNDHKNDTDGLILKGKEIYTEKNNATTFFSNAMVYLNMFHDDLQKSSNFISQLMLFKESETVQSTFDDKKHEEILKKINESKDSGEKLKQICELIIFDSENFYSISKGENFSHPSNSTLEFAKAWLTWSDYKEHPSVKSLMNSSKKIYDKFSKQLDELKRIKDKSTYSLKSIAEIEVILKDFKNNLDSIKPDKNLQNVEKILFDVKNMLDTNIKNCLVYLSKEKTNYESDTYTTIFSDKKRTELLQEFEKKKDLDESIIALLNVLNHDVNEILYSNTSSWWTKFKGLFGSDNDKKEIDEFYKKLTESFNEIKWKENQKFDIEEIISIQNHVQKTVNIVDEELNKLNSNGDDEEHWADEVSFEEKKDADKVSILKSVLKLFQKDFKQAELFISDRIKQIKDSGRLNKSDYENLNEFEKGRNEKLSLYNVVPDYTSRLHLLRRVVCYDLDEINKRIDEKNKFDIQYLALISDDSELKKKSLNNLIDISKNIGKKLSNLNAENYLKKLLEYSKNDLDLFEKSINSFLEINSKTYNKFDKVSYSKIDSINKDTYLDKDSPYAKRSGTRIKGKVISSFFLLQYSSETKNTVSGESVDVTDTTKAGQRIIRVIISLESKSKVIGFALPQEASSEIDDSYSIAEVSEVGVTILGGLEINIANLHVYIAYNDSTIGMPISIENIRNNLKFGNLDFTDIKSAKPKLKGTVLACVPLESNEIKKENGKITTTKKESSGIYNGYIWATAEGKGNYEKLLFSVGNKFLGESTYNDKSSHNYKSVLLSDLSITIGLKKSVKDDSKTGLGKFLGDIKNYFQDTFGNATSGTISLRLYLSLRSSSVAGVLKTLTGCRIKQLNAQTNIDIQ